MVCPICKNFVFNSRETEHGLKFECSRCGWLYNVIPAEKAEYEELKEIEEGFSGNRRSLKPFWKNITFMIK